MFHSSSCRRASLPGALLVLAAAVPVHAATLRVKADAPGPTHDGQTWQTAYTTVSSAIGAASALDDVWVAAGTYTDSIILKPGVSLYGGFNGNEATRDARNPRANETILDGEGASRVVYAPPGIGNDTTLDGFTIRNGTANTNPENGYGGGILCDQSGPNIVNNRITGCTATNGGAIAVKGAPAILLQGNTIVANTGGNPGVYLLDSTATLDGNTITGNRGIVKVPSSAGGVYCEGGEVNLSRCVIRGNAAYWSPTGAGAGGIVVAGDGSAVISSCLITDNTGLVGGLSAVNTRLESSLVAGNVGTTGAGGVSATACALVNDTIAANSDNSVVAVVFHGSGSRLHNTIIAFNAAGLAGVLSTSGAFSLSQSNNCVFGNAAFDYSGLASGSEPPSDPRFVNVAAGNFHIQPDSPCKDAGRFDLAPTGVDMDGEPRSQGRTVDIGADESNGTVWSAVPTVMHVRPDGSDAADGLTWQTAKQTPKAAVDALTGSGGEVWVAEGTYGPPTDEDAVVTLSSFVALYGGFTGDETARGERDWRAHRTVIDGNATHMGFHVFGGYRVTAVDGFTVTNTDNRGGWAGAAVMCAPMSAPIIAHNRLRGNRMGRLNPHPPNSAAALAVGGPALIAGNVITDNISDASGIGWYGGSPLIRNNTVVGNSGADGAAVHLEGQLPGAPLFVNNIFAHNTSGFFAPFHLAQLPDFRNNCIFDNGEGFVNIPDPTGSAGNIAADPLLADFEMGDNHLSAASPCVDAGEEFAGAAEALDMDGESRRIGAHVDIGADEFSGLISVPARHIVRVKTDGRDDADGSTWASGVKTIQHAVDLAAQTGGEVWVAAGEYTETVVLAPHVYLYGGFVGSETRQRDRNPDGRATTIHARAKGSTITATDLGVYAGVDGFVVAGGWTETMGGGIFSLNSSPTISNNFIRGNHAQYGAGIGLSRSFARIHDNTIGFNEAERSGGGIYSTDGSNPLVERNQIAANKAQYGGGIATGDASAMIRHNLISANEASVGTAFHADDNMGDGDLVNNTIVSNVAGVGQTTGACVSNMGHGLMANNIVAFNGLGVRWRDEIRNNDAYGNGISDYLSFSGPYPTGHNGNISVDPLFLDRAHQNYRLLDDSPARDAGDDTLVLPGELDLDGQPRIVGAHVDMGAYETPAYPAATVGQAVNALRIAGGLAAATDEEAGTLGNDGRMDIVAALKILRRAHGL